MRDAVRSLLPPNLPLWRFCLVAWPAALVPSFLLLLSVQPVLALFGRSVGQIDSPAWSVNAVDFVGIAVISPALETVLLIIGLRILLALRLPTVWAATVSAMAWGLAHGTVEVVWFFGTVWSFFVFSYAYLSWRAVSFKHAYLAAAVPHALVNATSMLLILLATAACRDAT